MERTLSGAGTPGQNASRNNRNPQKLKNWSLTIKLFNVISMTLVGDGGLPLCGDAANVFY